MRKLACAVMACGLFTTSLAVAGETGVNAQGYITCWSYADAHSPKVYYSAVFEGDGTMMEGAKAAFAQMLGSRYGFHDGVYCNLAYKRSTSVQKLMADHKVNTQSFRSQGTTVVETGWTYNGARAIGGAR